MEARAVANAIFEAQVAMCDLVSPGGSKRFGGTTAMVSGIDHPNFNTASPSGPSNAEEMTDALAYLERLGAPYSAMLLRGEDDDHTPTLEAAGMVELYEIPAMVCLDFRTAPWPKGLIRAEGIDAVDAHRQLIVESFKLAPDLVAALVGTALASDPMTSLVVGYVEGHPVTTALSIRIGDVIAVFNVATDPNHRGKGYGAAATSAVLEPGFADGIDAAVLQSSPSGLSVYESLGFVTVGMQDRWGFA
jgi:ribosomal protein S18 acetylase RimI-like enzyme